LRYIPANIALPSPAICIQRHLRLPHPSAGFPNAKALDAGGGDAVVLDSG
jgi:hypothetical protein